MTKNYCSFSGKATTTSGEFRIAAGSGRLPVVVLQHGSGGLGANIEMWERELNAIGVSTFALDGFTGRGLTQVSTDQALLGRLNFILDIYRALDVVAFSKVLTSTWTGPRRLRSRDLRARSRAGHRGSLTC
jgi:hypothetical protein